LQNLCRSNEPLNISSVGLFPVNISSSRMPRLYTSPRVETGEPSPYSDCAINYYLPEFGDNN
jgi:hypothetical protein